MIEAISVVNQAVCHIRQISYSLATAPCDRCGQAAPYFSSAERTAIDVELHHPVLLHITLSVHHCPVCQHYFRVQPTFLRRDAIYTNRVVDKAVQSVYQDGMAMRRVTARLARDFWVQPSEATIRGWCRSYGAGFDFEKDYQPWVVNQFSGILCVDEVYQDRLALLLAVDPAAADGDRLVGYQLVHGPVNADDVERFLLHLEAAGVSPDEVVTDGSRLYPSLLTKIWPRAAHQLCLFHETRHVTEAVLKVSSTVRKGLPHPLPAPGVKGGGPIRSCPPTDDANDPATQRWYWRQAQRHVHSAQVHALAEQSLSLRAIARLTGHHRQTIKKWLRQPVPTLPEGVPAAWAELATPATRPPARTRKQRLLGDVHRLSQQGLSCSAIARQVGLHRITVKRWLSQDPLPLAEVSSTNQRDTRPTPPPAPWTHWDEVRQVREALQEHRFLLLRRPEHLNPQQQQQLTALFESPVGAQLRIARSFLEDWYQLWTDEEGQRRSVTDAQTRYQAWRTNPAYASVPQLHRIQQQMTMAKFEHLSQFLRHPDWEATNNGAERAGRAFRHRQAPHFNLRNDDRIVQAITVGAHMRKEAALQPPPEPFHSHLRGRHKQQAFIVGERDPACTSVT